MTLSARRESALLMQIALPLMAAYLAEMAMFITTKMVVGKLGYHELATVGIAGNLSFEIQVILMGVLSIVGVLCAQAEGSGRNRDAGIAVRQGMLISIWLGLPATWLVWNMDVVLVELSRPYLRWLSGFVLPVLWFSVLRNFVAALARPRAVMVITVAAVAINYGLTWLLVYGAWGLPRMGLAGAGLATTLVSWMMFLSLLWYVYRTESLRGYGVFSGRWRVDRAVTREILLLGLPVGGLVLLEAGMFTAASILSGVISAETLAAYEIVLSWIGVSFMVALGVAEAAMVRVAHGVGRNRAVDARQAGLLAMGIGLLIVSILILVPLGLKDRFISIFISPTDPGFDIVAGMASGFFLIAALFQIFDGLQCIAARALRGLKDSVVPLWIAGFAYWVLGIGGGAWLAFSMGMNGTGLWWGMVLGLATAGILLAWRFHLLSNRLSLAVAAP
jgi:MATE family multidrug resistance protein